MMKQHLSAIISAVSVIVAALCLFRISDLETRIHSLENDVNNGFSRIEGTVNGISYNVRTALEEQTKLLSASEWQFDGYDLKAKTADVTCTVTPKEYQPEKTTASILWEEQEIPLKLENGTFTASFEIPLFENTRASRVQFVEGDTVRTETLDWYFYPKNELLPNVSANLYGSVSYPHMNGVTQWRGNSTVEVNIDINKTGSMPEIVSLKLLRYLDDTLTDTIDMLGENTIEEKSEYMQFYSYPLEQSFDIPNGSTQKLYVAAEDADGLVHVVLVDQVTIDSKGSPDHSRIIRHWEADIYDVEGNFIYAVDKSLYQ